VTVAVPLALPQVALTVLVERLSEPVPPVTVNDLVVVQPFASVTVTVYVPTERFLAVSDVC
jgi:hypothetical protein